MATKKQRKRRQKDRRHEWEYVYVDEEGHEVEVEEGETDTGSGARSASAEKPSGQAKAPAKGRGATRGRTVEPPSWRRVLRRGAIFAPIMFLVISFLSKNLTLQQKLVQTLFLLAFFIPFSYLMDVLMYRAYRRRMDARAKPTDKKR